MREQNDEQGMGKNDDHVLVISDSHRVKQVPPLR